MSDIFISYASEDRVRAQVLAAALEQHGWSVWWDRTIPPGKTFDQVIEEALDASRSVIVVWSEAAVASQWVRAEAGEGRRRGILIPVLIQDVQLPLAFRQIHAAGLIDWQGDPAHPGFGQLVSALSGLLGKPAPAQAEPAEGRRAEDEEKRKADEEEASRTAEAEKQKRAQAEAKRKAEEEARQKAVLEAERRAAADAKREAEKEARRTAELEEKAGARAEAVSVQPAPKPSPWERVGPAKWLVVAALVLLIAGGVWYAGNQYSVGEQVRLAAEQEAQRKAEEAAKRKAVKERKEAERYAPGQTFKDCPDCPEMVVVPAGSFMMGSPVAESGRVDKYEGPQRRVRISRPLAIGQYEVTFAEWDTCAANGGCNAYRPGDSGWGRGRRPVINVSWDDAKAYVGWLSKVTGESYRLPTEAEWWYAARSGRKTHYYFGDEILEKNANFGRKVDKTTEVGSYPANSWKLHDMHGNVWEWVEDCWNTTYEGVPTDGSAWTKGDCRRRVLRGGSWVYSPWVLHSAIRGRDDSGHRFHDNGFRVARTLP